MDFRIHFSDFFDIDTKVLEDYGAFDVSLIADMPVFIDPFRLYASDKKEYQELHDLIIKYLCFLRDYCQANATMDIGKMQEYFCFPEVKNLYMGFSETGNNGRGLGKEFAKVLYRCFTGKLSDFGKETVTQSSHLEKLCVIAEGVGRDFVSDFSANLIKGYLLEFTENFARKSLNKQLEQGSMMDIESLSHMFLREVRDRHYFTKPTCFNDEFEYRIVWEYENTLEKEYKLINLDDPARFCRVL